MAKNELVAEVESEVVLNKLAEKNSRTPMRKPNCRRRSPLRRRNQRSNSRRHQIGSIIRPSASTRCDGKYLLQMNGPRKKNASTPRDIGLMLKMYERIQWLNGGSYQEDFVDQCANLGSGR